MDVASEWETWEYGIWGGWGVYQGVLCGLVSFATAATASDQD